MSGDTAQHFFLRQVLKTSISLSTLELKSSQKKKEPTSQLHTPEKPEKKYCDKLI